MTSLKIMEFFGYKHLEEITVRRQDDKLYKFREGDFKRLHRKDIEDMLLLLVQGKLTNLNVDDRFALNVVLRMYTRRIMIPKDVHQKSGYSVARFIYVDDHKRNRLMHSDELYKFSDGTLTRLLSLLEDITKNINMEYLPKRRWSNLEKKRAHFMIKDINKLLKEMSMMRSLEKFVGGRLYGTDPRLLQRTI
ncbi:hypothetical protein Tco_0952188 [Tanacetum coccineum]|uniref:Uncharacterized protein n=1 Tax=Tanacetum coccineum TaxID=301880 RepID=A0ABQ5DY46_9ASTR